MIRRWTRLLEKRDAGVTLVELMVAMFITSLLGMVLVTTLTAVYRTQRNVDNEASGLADVRTVVERLGRDLRDARGVDAGATTSNLRIWIDLNSDYVRDPTNQPDEIITWALQSGTFSQHYNVLRSTQGGQTREEAHTLVSNIAFCYQTVQNGPCLNPPPPDPSTPPVPLTTAQAASVKLVTVTVQYNAAPSLSTAKQRTTTFTERLRNV